MSKHILLFDQQALLGDWPNMSDREWLAMHWQRESGVQPHSSAFSFATSSGSSMLDQTLGLHEGLRYPCMSDGLEGIVDLLVQEGGSRGRTSTSHYSRGVGSGCPGIGSGYPVCLAQSACLHRGQDSAVISRSRTPHAGRIAEPVLEHYKQHADDDIGQQSDSRCFHANSSTCQP